jgi:fluoride ion exporter CrcB/FEX
LGTLIANVGGGLIIGFVVACCGFRLYAAGFALYKTI